MRVVFFNPTGQLGGTERSLLEILASLRAGVPGGAIHLIMADDVPLVSKAFARRTGDRGSISTLGSLKQRLFALVVQQKKTDAIAIRLGICGQQLPTSPQAPLPYRLATTHKLSRRARNMMPTRGRSGMPSA
jgi:hypothetical protein